MQKASIIEVIEENCQYTVHPLNVGMLGLVFRGTSFNVADNGPCGLLQLTLQAPTPWQLQHSWSCHSSASRVFTFA